MAGTFYITTPIYYVNAKPHLGHAYSTIVADVAARFHSMRQHDTCFLTGTDEHGDKVVDAAKKENLEPRVYVDMISAQYRSLWPELNIKNDYFIRTTDPGHIEVVRQVLQKIYDSGDIYFSEYEGLYCFGCERFYTERELLEGRCPDHGTVPELILEANYFFKMSKYQDWLVDHINRHPDFIRPERYRNEVLSFLNEPLEDLCISRPKTRLEWGITLPFDDKYVTYVWFDALLNYVSALGYPDGSMFKKFWPHVQHIVAKDILKPHGIYWPTMLKAAGIDVYQHLNVHGYWNIDQSKMSKSIGNVVDPRDMKNRYGLDAFRYFLMREMVFGLDSSFSEDAMIQRINSDLANDLGNLFSRVFAMAQKYFDGIIPEVDGEAEAAFSSGLEAKASVAISGFVDAMESFEFQKALRETWEFISHMNKYIDTAAPWELAKKESDRKQLEVVMYHLLEGLRVIAGLIYPVMPGTAETIMKHLGLNNESRTGCETVTVENLFHWGAMKPGVKLLKPVALFPRIESGKPPAEGKPPASPVVKLKPEIEMEDFSRVDLRVATVLNAEAIPNAKKLLKVEVDIGEKRTIVAGISEHYKPEALIGKQVIIVANLKPVKLMGVRSEGMIIAATDDGGLSVATLDGKRKPGAPLK